MPGDRRGFASVVFDCDSTLSAVEGIDELAGERAEEVARLTDLAMTGRIPLEEVYGRRMGLIQPDRASVEALGDRYIAALIPDAQETVAALRSLGKTVRIVSGGLLPPVLAVASALGLDAEDVAAVGVSFTETGRYADYERESPLARSGGKADVIRAWDLPRPILLVGDGATDLEARPAVDALAAFTAIAHRQEVARAAEFVLSARSLAPVLAIAASAEDLHRLRGSERKALLSRGERLLGTALPLAPETTGSSPSGEG